MRNRNRKFIGLIAVFVGILLLTAVAVVAYAAIRESGKRSLTSQWKDIVPEPIPGPAELTEVEKIKWQAGWVRYDGKIYEYNRELLNFLVMGIDETGKMADTPEGTRGGQADALFLIILNPAAQSLKVISINRNTMADVDLYDVDGTYLDTVKAQIAVQHGFGDGKEESCEYQVEAVRKLFYNIPIHGYCAINMEAVATLVDLAGGIELTALEEVRLQDVNQTTGWRTVKKGEQVRLTGADAYSYVQYRDVSLVGSADGRLERQKQFLGLFIQKMKEAIKKDITIPLQFYDAIIAQMVTDITADEVVYLAGEMPVDLVAMDTIMSLTGETVKGERFEEYHVDEQALYQLIIDVFYQPVEAEQAD